MMANCADADETLDFDEDEEIDIDELCANPCIQALIPCSNNPLIRLTMGPDEAEGIAALRPMCAPTPAGATGPGDGICDFRSMVGVCDEGQMDEACEEDMDCFCGTACVLEMMVRKRIRLPSSFSFLTLISAL